MLLLVVAFSAGVVLLPGHLGVALGDRATGEGVFAHCRDLRVTTGRGTTPQSHFRREFVYGFGAMCGPVASQSLRAVRKHLVIENS